MKATLAPQKASTKANNNFTNLKDIQAKLHDALYIGAEFVPEKKNIGRCYRSDFTLKTRKEAEALVKEDKTIFYHKDKDTDFFVYNERAGELVPFKKNDYLIYDRGYLAFDGKDYLSYDDHGKEI